MTRPVIVAEDRTLRVPAGALVRTGYVEVHRVRLACRDRMAIGDVEAAYRKRLQLGSDQPWPPPVGDWEDETFCIHDGRHEYVAALMLGCTHVLVAWIEPETPKLAEVA
jgi:hypothetical protein